DVVDLGEVDDHVRALVFENVFERRGEELRGLAELDQAFDVQNGEVVDVFLFDDHAANPSKSEAMNGSDCYDAVHSAEAEGARKKDRHAPGARCVGDVIEVALRIGRVQVDRRRDHAVVERGERAGDLDRAA